MPRLPCRVLTLFAAGLLFLAACSSQNAANSKVAALSTVSAVVVGGALSPVGNALNKLSGSDHERRLTYPAVYNLGDGRIAIANRTGWFTDKSDLGPGQDGQSAWVIDLRTGSRNGDGVIVLANDNLDRWFFRDHDRVTLRPILHEGPLQTVNTTTGDRVRMEANRTHITLLLGGASHRFMLSQDPIETLQPAANK